MARRTPEQKNLRGRTATEIGIFGDEKQDKYNLLDRGLDDLLIKCENHFNNFYVTTSQDKIYRISIDGINDPEEDLTVRFIEEGLELTKRPLKKFAKNIWEFYDAPN